MSEWVWGQNAEEEMLGEKWFTWGFSHLGTCQCCFMYVQSSGVLCFPDCVSGYEILYFMLSWSLLCLSVKYCTLRSCAVLAWITQKGTYLILWITYSVLVRHKHCSAHRNPDSLFANTMHRVLVAAQSKGRCEVFTLSKYGAQKNKSSCEEMLVLNSDNFDVLLLVCLYCCGEGGIRWLYYSSISQKSLIYQLRDVCWLMAH